ncbi:AraC family transcriptional regulator [Paucilactobacillus suebicus]|uniref:helix-turn-helix domain-containing protein n=1 Tax=Paucilactobacillus suebicus TaxID=152335 RepID=UPI00024901B6|nr:AraC family transcriptional regulator [Paucilactobacillus suebicus]
MENKLYLFNLSKLPMFYVSGYLDISSNWQHKHMYQQGNWEIIFVLDGVIYLNIEGQEYEIHKNSYFLVPPYKNMEGYKESPVGTRMLWIHFFPREDVKEVENIDNSDYYSSLIPQHGIMYDSDPLLVIAYEILDSAQKKKGLSIDLQVTQLLMQLGEDFRQASIHSRSLDKSIENIDVWIDAHLDEIDTVADIGLAFNFNSVYLNRLFKDKHHTSLYQYVITQKIKRAENLLISSGIPISEVSKNSFFKDKRNFSRTFKKRVGITPEKYRQLFKSKFINSPSYDPEIPVPERIKVELKKNNSKST